MAVDCGSEIEASCPVAACLQAGEQQREYSQRHQLATLRSSVLDLIREPLADSTGLLLRSYLGCRITLSLLKAPSFLPS